LITSLLTSFFYTGKTGILVTDVDYPALADIDGDGDLDLLTFFGLGSYVEYHQNLSMEKYGHCDSLDFKLSDPCWGKFRESEGGNRISLNEPCQFEGRSTNDKVRTGGSRHSGSTMLATDLNGDGLTDLILGDVDYPGLVALYNGGTPDSAFMVAQDTAFPSNAPVHLFSFPGAFLVDVNNDGLTDLIASPFDPALNTSDNDRCVQWFRNTGTNGNPHFEYQPGSLFRDDMLDFGSASHPVVFDFDMDGLDDLFVGNLGYYDSSYYYQAVLHSDYTSGVSWYRNTGTATAPVFTCTYSPGLETLPTLGLKGCYPAFCDLTGDGLPDMLLGNSDGTLLFFKNTGSPGGVPTFATPVLNWQSIDVGGYSAPQFFDLDKDNLPDLVIGEQSGNLNYYKKTGAPGNQQFTLVTDSLGGINVTNYSLSYDGYSIPCFARDTEGSTILLVGSQEGRIRYYTGIDGNLSGKFTETPGLYDWLSATPADTLFGWQTSPATGHLTSPGSFDLVTGNFAGGLNYITKRIPAQIIPGIGRMDQAVPRSLRVFPNPACSQVSIAMTGNQKKTNSPLTIYTLSGTKIAEYPFPGSLIITVEHLPAGFYLIRCGELAARLIITHP
jgi:hypothetical protein